MLNPLVIVGTWLFLDDRWDCPIPNPPARPLLFYRVFWCIIWVVWVDFCFWLRSCDQKYSKFNHFPCILQCLFFLVFDCSKCVCGGGRSVTSTLECKKSVQMLRISDHKNVKKKKNHLTPLKLYSKKQDEKVIALREGSGRVDPIERLGRATSHLLLDLVVGRGDQLV